MQHDNMPPINLESKAFLVTPILDADCGGRLDKDSLAPVCQFSGLGLLLSLVTIVGSTADAAAIAVGLGAALAVVVSIGLGFALAAAAAGEPSGPPHFPSPW
jgi:hypothetical protein